MNKTKTTHHMGVYKRLLSLLLVMSIFITSSNLEQITTKVAEAVATAIQIYLVDNTNGHDHYEMTEISDGMWQVVVPSTATNITFNRLSNDKSTTWNSFSAGGRGTNNVYYAGGSEYGHWEFSINEAAFSGGDVIYLDVSEFTSWGNDGAKYYINFSDMAISSNSKIYIYSLTSSDGYDIR